MKKYMYHSGFKIFKMLAPELYRYLIYKASFVGTPRTMSSTVGVANFDYSQRSGGRLCN